MRDEFAEYLAVSVVTLRFPTTYDVVSGKSSARLPRQYRALDTNIKRSSDARGSIRIDLVSSLLLVPARSYRREEMMHEGDDTRARSESRVAESRESGIDTESTAESTFRSRERQILFPPS